MNISHLAIWGKNMMASLMPLPLTFRVKFVKIRFIMTNNIPSPESEAGPIISAPDALVAIGALGEISSATSAMMGLLLILRTSAESMTPQLLSTTDCLVGIGFLGGVVSLIPLGIGFALKKLRAS